jgi:hypothetical protein
MNSVNCLLLYAAISTLSVAEESEPDPTPFIPAGINIALGAVREGMAVEDVVKLFRAFCPDARMTEIVGGLATGSAGISLGDGIEVGLRVRPTSGIRDWVVADASAIWISDWTKRQAIKVQFVPITAVDSKKADGTGPPATRPVAEPEDSGKPTRAAGPEMISSGIVLLDGSSSYTFSKDGKFTSTPLDWGGRTFEGNWEMLEGKSGGLAKVIVRAKEGWRDGIQPSDSFRRIVFIIFGGDTVPYVRPDDPTGKLARMCQNPKAYFKCYWLIDEMTKIEAPHKAKAKQGGLGDGEKPPN